LAWFFPFAWDQLIATELLVFCERGLIGAMRLFDAPHAARLVVARRSTGSMSSGSGRRV